MSFSIPCGRGRNGEVNYVSLTKVEKESNYKCSEGTHQYYNTLAIAHCILIGLIDTDKIAKIYSVEGFTASK